MRRITIEDLDHVVDAINTLQGIPLETWTKVEDKYGGYEFVPTAWNYHIGGANGGYALHQHGSSGTGIRDIFQVGHVSKRELHGLLQAYLAGLRVGWKNGVREVFTSREG
jgi:hypothetical protein